MRVDSHGRVTKGCVQDNIGRFTTYPWQGLQRLSVLWYFAVIFVQQDLAGLDDIAGLAVIQAYRLNVFLQAIQAKVENSLRGIGNRVEFVRGLVDADIGSLCRQDDCNKQLESIRVIQFGRRMWIGLS